ncbi:MAG: hypothetical protein K0R20_2345 [Actinomycetia bacterium]|jgi:hypothetical protein|nr:hypothetical protein [Actinomycetes bacterium]
MTERTPTVAKTDRELIVTGRASVGARSSEVSRGPFPGSVRSRLTLRGGADR